MQNSFVLIGGGGKERFVICIAKVPLLFCLNTQIDSSQRAMSLKVLKVHTGIK